MRILIADDEPLARARLAALLRDCEGAEVVASVGDGETALAACAQHRPALLLQPLVENAVYHGIQPRRDGGTLRIAARRVADSVEIEVANPLPDTSAPARSGHGLDNVRRRIAYHFGERGALETCNQDGEFRVLVRLPCAS